MLSRLKPDSGEVATLGAPEHLTERAREWVENVTQEYALDPHHRHLLVLAAEALDRGEEARIALADHGMTYLDRFGAPRSHPAVAVERDSRLAFARLLRELDLDGAPAPDSRPPRGR